jgi:hypothetical protein
VGKLFRINDGDGGGADAERDDVRGNCARSSLRLLCQMANSWLPGTTDFCFLGEFDEEIVAPLTILKCVTVRQIVYSYLAVLPVAQEVTGVPAPCSEPRLSPSTPPRKIRPTLSPEH